MLRPQFIMFLAWVVIIGNLFCVFLEGTSLGSEDQSLANFLTGYSSMSSGGVGIPSMVIGFFINGFPRLLMWDFSFFRGGAELIRWVLMVFSIGATAGLALTFLPSVMSTVFGRR